MLELLLLLVPSIILGLLATWCMGLCIWGYYQHLFHTTSSLTTGSGDQIADISATASTGTDGIGESADGTHETDGIRESADGKQEIRIEVECQSSERLRIVQGCSDIHFGKGSPPPTVLDRQRAKNIQQQWAMLKDSLPPSISVVVYEDRIDLMQAVIIGAAGTPYHDGLFFFDISFPPGYPDSPPFVHFHSHGLRVNPNLYSDGKVCRSLLNTWTGSINEKWLPKKSTILQLLISIQGLVLNEKPFFNEPGSTAVARFFPNLSQRYSEVAFIESLKLMVFTMRKPPKHFKEFVESHFRDRARVILQACQSHMVECRRKAQIDSIFPKLVDAFTKIGADCGQSSR